MAKYITNINLKLSWSKLYLIKECQTQVNRKILNANTNTDLHI